MDKESLIQILEKARFISGEAEEAYDEIQWLNKRTGILYPIKWTALIFGVSFFVAPILLITGENSGNETMEFIGNAYYDYYIFVLLLFLPAFIFSKRRKKFIIKRNKRQSFLDRKDEQLAKIAHIPNKFKNSYDLGLLIEYLQDGRVDNLKEGINLLIKEENEERRHNEMMGQIEDNRREMDRRLDNIASQQKSDASYLSSQLDDIEVKVRNID